MSLSMPYHAKDQFGFDVSASDNSDDPQASPEPESPEVSIEKAKEKTESSDASKTPTTDVAGSSGGERPDDPASADGSPPQ